MKVRCRAARRSGLRGKIRDVIERPMLVGRLERRDGVFVVESGLGSQYKSLSFAASEDYALDAIEVRWPEGDAFPNGVLLNAYKTVP